MSSPDPHHAAGARGLVAVSLAGVLWGTTGVVVQYLHRTVGLGAISIGFWRLLIAAVAMVAISVPTFRRLLSALRHHKLGMIGAGVGLAFYQACYFLAVVWVGVAVATMVSLGVAPVVITLWESVRWRRRPPARRMGAVIMALVGLVLIQNGGQEAGGPHPGWGLVAALMSGTVYAATAVLSSRLTRTVPSTALTTVMVVAGALALLPSRRSRASPARHRGRASTVCRADLHRGRLHRGRVRAVQRGPANRAERRGVDPHPLGAADRCPAGRDAAR